VSNRKHVGARGEDLVAEYLEKAGYSVVARNARVGRLELDLVATRADLFVFCEVRTRSNDRFMDPAASIVRAKALNIRRAALGWLNANALFARELRFDAAAVVLEPPRLTYYEGAF
jgi:putative endonuclease